MDVQTGIAGINKTKRLEWLDALRGFTMILVVANHISTLAFKIDVDYSTLFPLSRLFRMPLFFFISGFLAYKASLKWTGEVWKSMLWKKFKIQVIPTLIFMTVFCLVCYKHFWQTWIDSLTSPQKRGYWFTLTLLWMFFMYYSISLFQEWIDRKKNKKSFPTLLLITWILFFALAILWPDRLDILAGKCVVTRVILHTTFINAIIYFQFFIYGYFVHRYWDKVQSLFSKTWFFPILVLIAFATAMECIKWKFFEGMPGVELLIKNISSYSLMTIVLMFFRHYGDSFTKQRFLGRSLQYIGVRTLDIYLIHYILLPKMPYVGEFLKQYPNNFVLEAVLSISMAIVVILFCILISNTLRISPFLKKHLFGR